MTETPRPLNRSVSTDPSFDVVVCGGGLAGLTFARQLRREVPDARVAVLERTRRPLPHACHKVGESSVELGSLYLARFLGLEAYLRDEHLLKNGLRFFCGAAQGPVPERPEVGPSEVPAVPSFQVDRGKLENDLRRWCEEQEVSLFEGWEAEDVGFGEPHRVHVRGSDGTPTTLAARWLVDATGRRRLIQRKLGLGKASPNLANAAWFRVADRIKVGELAPSEPGSWHARDVDDNRWLSTNHLMGPGYWVWLIPLPDGYTSVGIVADEAYHDFASFSRADRALAWIRAHEPNLAERLGGHDFADFRVMRRYSYLTERAISRSRWACIGEAGLFVDPLYSPGTDFIALGNSMTCRLIRDDMQGELATDDVDELDRFYREAGRDAIETLSGNGDVFGHGPVLAAKLWWDFGHYWAFLCQYFGQRVYALPRERLLPFHEMARHFRELNEAAQRIVRTWAQLRPERGPGEEERGFLPAPMFPSVLANLHLALEEQRTPEQTLARMNDDLQTCRELVVELVVQALRDLGPDRARDFGALCPLDELPVQVDAQRIEMERLPRRVRRDRIPAVARDLERVFGRSAKRAGLDELITLASASPAREAPSPQSAE